MESKVKGAEDKADKAMSELAIHRVHAAETFATKAGMQGKPPVKAAGQAA